MITMKYRKFCTSNTMQKSEVMRPKSNLDSLATSTKLHGNTFLEETFATKVSPSSFLSQTITKSSTKGNSDLKCTVNWCSLSNSGDLRNNSCSTSNTVYCNVAAGLVGASTFVPFTATLASFLAAVTGMVQRMRWSAVAITMVVRRQRARPAPCTTATTTNAWLEIDGY